MFNAMCRALTAPFWRREPPPATSATTTAAALAPSTPLSFRVPSRTPPQAIREALELPSTTYDTHPCGFVAHFKDDPVSHFVVLEISKHGNVLTQLDVCGLPPETRLGIGFMLSNRGPDMSEVDMRVGGILASIILERQLRSYVWWKGAVADASGVASFKFNHNSFPMAATQYTRTWCAVQLRDVPDGLRVNARYANINDHCVRFDAAGADFAAAKLAWQWAGNTFRHGMLKTYGDPFMPLELRYAELLRQFT